MPSYPLNREEFERKRSAGEFNPLADYEDYQAMLRDREEMRREIEAAAHRAGVELGAPELDLSPEDEAVLDRVWARLGAEENVAENETDYLNLSIAWEKGDAPRFPFVAEIEGQRFLIRLNNFPDEPLYTLFIGDVAVVDFDDWPMHWQGLNVMAVAETA